MAAPRALHGTRHLEAIALRNSATKAPRRVPCSAVFVFIGAEPPAEWLPAAIARDAKGYVLTGTDAVRSGSWPRGDRDPCPLETTVPGILAAGDIRSGSTKRVGFAVGDQTQPTATRPRQESEQARDALGTEDQQRDRGGP